jgi:hypothetical protein
VESNDPVRKSSGEETLRGDRVDLFASGGIRDEFLSVYFRQERQEEIREEL